jgi:hypothetical protein
MCNVNNSHKFPLQENILLKIRCNYYREWSSSEKIFSKFTLYIYSKIVSCMRIYQVFLILFLHFLYWAFRMTSLNLWRRIIPMDWMQKKSWTSDSFTWSISIDLPRTRMLIINKTPFDICGKKENVDNGNSLVYVGHNCNQLN